MANIETDFPKNLSYNLKELAGGFNKQKVKVLGDLQTTSASGVIRFKLLPTNAIVDLRCLVLYFTGSSAGTGSTTSYIRRFTQFFPDFPVFFLFPISKSESGKKKHKISPIFPLFPLFFLLL